MCNPTSYHYISAIIIIAMPILNMISFFCLDHSVWNVVEEDSVGVDVDVDVDVDDTNDNCVDLEGDDTTMKKVTNEEEKSNDNSAADAPKKNDQIDKTTKRGEGSDEIRSIDLRQIEHDFKTLKQQQGSKKSFAKSIRDTLGSEMKPMTLKDYMLASKEMLKYWALYMVNFMAAQFFLSALFQPTLVESSASYHGIEGGAGSKTGDTILLVNHVLYVVITRIALPSFSFIFVGMRHYRFLTTTSLSLSLSL
jgi:hypothetical protein